MAGLQARHRSQLDVYKCAHSVVAQRAGLAPRPSPQALTARGLDASHGPALPSQYSVQPGELGCSGALACDMAAWGEARARRRDSGILLAGLQPQLHTWVAALVLWGCLLRSGAWHEQCAGPRWCSSEHRPELEQLHVSDRGKPENCPLLLKPPEAPGKPRVGGCSWPQSVAVTPDFGAAHSSFMLQR